MNRRPIVFAAIVIVALVVLTVITAPSSDRGFSEKDAIDASLQAAISFASDNYKGLESQLEIISASNKSGKWSITMMLTVLPHSRCPEMQRLTYELYPITLRNDTIVSSKDCHARPVTNAAEAIIASYAGSSTVRQLESGGYQACGFTVPIANVSQKKNYCDALDENSTLEFTQKNRLPEGTWVVQWYFSGKSSYFVAVDSGGIVIADTTSTGKK
ncbi:MAG: hypothetical protein WC408_00260 [Candidatus Micrarchaeia archaeon]